MCHGNDSPPAAPYIPPPKKAPKIPDVIDEIAGVQTTTVIGADGKKRRVTTRLPRTPEEEQRFRAGEELIKSSLDNLKKLYKFNPESMVSFKPFVDAFANLNRERQDALGQIANIGDIKADIEDFRQIQGDLLERDISRNRRSIDNNLAHRGIGDSTYAAESRAALSESEGLMRRQNDINANMYGEDLAARRLDRNAKAFGLQEIGRQARFDEAQMGYGLAKDHEADMERRRQGAIGENMNLLGVGQGIIGNDLAKNQAGKTGEMALNLFQAQANDSLARYNAGVNAQMANHKMAMESYNAQPPSFGEMAMNIGGRVAGHFIGGPVGGEIGGQIGSQMGGGRMQPGRMYPGNRYGGR